MGSTRAARRAGMSVTGDERGQKEEDRGDCE